MFLCSFSQKRLCKNMLFSILIILFLFIKKNSPTVGHPSALQSTGLFGTERMMLINRVVFLLRQYVVHQVVCLEAIVCFKVQSQDIQFQSQSQLQRVIVFQMMQNTKLKKSTPKPKSGRNEATNCKQVSFGPFSCRHHPHHLLWH